MTHAAPVSSSQDGRSPAFPLAPGSAARCPKCNGAGYYVRTRYFDGEAADVWECQSPLCKSFGLLWHVSRPYSDEENMALATQMTDAEPYCVAAARIQQPDA